MADFIELGFTGLEKAADKYYEKAYDRMPNPRDAYQRARYRRRSKSQPDMAQQYYQNGYNGYPPNAGYNNGYAVGQPNAGPSGYNDNSRRQSNDAGNYYDDNGYSRNNYQQSRYIEDDTAQQYNGTRGSYEQDTTSRSRSRRDYDRRSRGRSPSTGRRDRDRSRSRSRSRGMNIASIGASVVGAVAGGLAGNEFGHGDLLGTVAGAVVGAIGANKLEHKYEKKKDLHLKKLWDEGKGGHEERRRRRRSR